MDDVVDVKCDSPKIEEFFYQTMEQFVASGLGTGIFQDNEEDNNRLMKAFSKLRDVKFSNFSEVDRLKESDACIDYNKDGTKSILVTEEYKGVIEGADDMNDSKLSAIKKTFFHEMIHLMQPRMLNPFFKEVGAELGALKMMEYYEKTIKGNRETMTARKPVENYRYGFTAPCIIRNRQEQYSDFEKIPLCASYPVALSASIDLAKCLGRRPSEFINNSFDLNLFACNLAADYNKATGTHMDVLLRNLEDYVENPTIGDDNTLSQISVAMKNLKEKTNTRDTVGLTELQI